MKVYMSGTKIMHEIVLKFILRKLLMRSRYSDGLWAGRTGFDSWQGKRFFSFPVSRPAVGPTQRPIQWVPGAISMEVKQPGRDAGHSSPPRFEINNGDGIPPLPHTYSGVVVN
jgi:hypothetical protein